MRLARQIGETMQSWLARMEEFWQTDEGRALYEKETAAFAEQREREERAKLREQEARQQAAIAAIGIPDRVLEIIRAGTRQTEATQAIGAETILVLSGNPGCGKTIAACDWLHSSGSGLFVKSARLARWDRYNDAEMRRLLEASRLVLDDLGTEYQDVKGNFDSILDELIDVRYDKRLATVITTNLDAQAFKAKYGERIADRIREAGKFVSLAAKSMRGVA